ncbi:UDP-glucuronosyl/UDP-glucosyltransferase [Trema orientale]|uniref:Glycosyltransferase n=1 Tax=Trema orientale TaxID=63057 RepID=A0A2P5E7Q7_TREOI|nr:UDP-glucuronosyl/UDP-glucosyltransferase [Trema orientale]
MLELAKLLVTRDASLSITVLIMKLPGNPNLAAYTDSLVASNSISERIRFIDITQPEDKINSAETNPLVFVDLFIKSHKPHVKNAVTDLFQTDNSPRRLAGFVVHMAWTEMMDVANEFKVPTYVFWPSPAGWLGLNFHLQALREERDMHVDLKNKLANDYTNGGEFLVPSFANPVPTGVIPSMVLDKSSADVFLTFVKRIRETAKGVIVNTFAELESHAVGSMISDGKLPAVYSVGPIVNLKGEGSHAFSVGTEAQDNESNIIEWLDDQPDSSVIFLCFGSCGSFGEDQVKEIATALERTGLRFLWSVRRHPGLTNKDSTTTTTKLAFASDFVDPKEVVPEGFLDRTAGVGKVISWAPQVAVLSHRAVGGFVSHCGWNSLLESLWFGVPVATWPLFAEQQLNAFQMVKEFGLAVEINTGSSRVGDKGVVSAKEIEDGIMRVMETHSDIRKRVKEISQKSRKTMIEGGSSYSSLGRFVSDVLENLY